MNASETMNRVLVGMSNKQPNTAMDLIQIYNEAYDRLPRGEKTLEKFLVAWHRPILEEMLLIAKEVIDE